MFGGNYQRFYESQIRNQYQQQQQQQQQNRGGASQASHNQQASSNANSFQRGYLSPAAQALQNANLNSHIYQNRQSHSSGGGCNCSSRR